MSEQFPYGTLTWTTEAQMACKALEDAYGLPPDNLEEYVRALVAWAGLVVQYMEKGEPYWYGDSLKEQGRAALAPFVHLGGEP